MSRKSRLSSSAIFIAMVACVGFLTPLQGSADTPQEAEITGQSTRPTLRQFDEDVAQCRREMRKYCAITQQIMGREGDHALKIQEALNHLTDAQAQWEMVRVRYQENPPAEYAADVRFKQRLADIAEAMKEMAETLHAGDTKKSFQSCGFACGIFTAMHEENNLVYALDSLFHFRRTLKRAMNAHTIGGPDALASFLPDLLRLRDRVLLAPCPWPDDDTRCHAYRAAVTAFSGLLDELAINATMRETEATARLVKDVFDKMQEAYGAAL